MATEHFNLYTLPVGDTTSNIIDWRDNIAGDTDSNMIKIDTAMYNISMDNVHKVAGSQVTANNYTGTNANISSYTDNLIIAFRVPSDNTGASALTINALTPKPIKKIENGLPVSLAGKELLNGTTTLLIFIVDHDAWIIMSSAGGGTVKSVNDVLPDNNGNVQITKTNVGLGNVDNTSDLNKPISNATQTALNNKVDKVVGKGLSENDYTTAEKNKLAGIEVGAQKNTVTSVAGKTGDVTLGKGDVGLGNVDNTSDANKPVSTATQTALNNKVDKVAGKGLSENDYTTIEKNKLAGIETGAQKNTVTSVASKTGAVTLTKSDVGLGNVDNTSDANKPVSTAQAAAIAAKADKPVAIYDEITLLSGDWTAVTLANATSIYGSAEYENWFQQRWPLTGTDSRIVSTNKALASPDGRDWEKFAVGEKWGVFTDNGFIRFVAFKKPIDSVRFNATLQAVTT